ncbi:MAG: phosphate ABC transporter substrate-binding protein [Nitrospina sp.]|nr:phosphate ABC transporter substrate-binding protein [Nitrospina sp.]MDC0206533.1 PstS family phosphate ABC transporter substrate-binding protein [Nitrospinota bacterium]|tara:strand:+ start:2689 stop:3669 length:981 start_codon:yes stop_codon:yes gene_type:complete
MKKLLMLIILSAVFLLSMDDKSFAEGLFGKIRINGSSTVFPITEAVAEEFQKLHRKVRVTVGISGTGGGFKKFATGQTDINDASRPIKGKEKDKAEKNGIDYIELPVAYDGLSVVVNPKNEFLDYLTVTELRKIWQPGSTVKNWNDVRPDWPNKPIKLYGPGADSGTFDYFTKKINGKSQASRSDYTASEDDNVLVMGVAGDTYSLGYFGYAYYKENQDKLKVVAIDGGDGPIKPSETTINDGTYKPLSRPIFIYVSNKAAKRPVIKEFVSFYLKNATVLSKEVGYVPLPDTKYQQLLDQFEKWSTMLVGKKSLESNVTKVSLKDN